MGKIYIQIFGIQRSSTTYATNLIHMNGKNVVVSTDNKHTEPKDADVIEQRLRKRLVNNEVYKTNKVHHERLSNLIKDLFELDRKMHPVVVIKNPYSWYQSISRWRLLHKDSFRMEVWYDRYNKFYRSWKKLLENPRKPYGKGMVIRYEDLLRSPSDFIYTLRDRFGVSLKGKIKTTDRMASVNSKFESEPKIFTEKRKQFYLQDGDFGLSNELINKITELIDWELMKFYGYKPK